MSSPKKEKGTKFTGNNSTIVQRNSNSTLEEFLLASPYVPPQSHTLQSDFALKQLFLKVHPSSSSSEDYGSADFFTPRISFSSDKVGLLGKQRQPHNNQEDDQEMYQGTTQISDEKLKKKRVSFRLPQEADIFVFHSSPSPPH